MSVEKLKQALKEKKDFTFGEKGVLKRVKLGKAKVVFLAKDCRPDTRETITHYSKQTEFELIELDINSSEVGTICKKQFFISTLCY